MLFVNSKRFRNKICGNMYRKKKSSLARCCRGIFILLVITSAAFIFALAMQACKPMGYSCFGLSDIVPAPLSDYDSFYLSKLRRNSFNSSVLDRGRKLDLEGGDVLIYLHMQKTGGATLGRHLVHNLDVDFPCKCMFGVKRCECLTKNGRRWLFSRHATGWMCGLHADWTELTDCVDRWFKYNDVKSRKHRTYHYMTILRNPVKRFLSEWQHVRRGATWKAARLHCNGRDASLEEVPFCFSGVSWSGVTLDEFLACKHNLAFNRMTRMLANLSQVNCYNQSGLDQKWINDVLFQSAKKNIQEFAFFGIVEEQEKTQFLFENTMGIKFINNFRQKNDTHASRLEVSDDMMKKVLDKNKLDVELYNFARDLFLQRVAYVEQRLGYTMDEYFNHVRGTGNSRKGDNKNVRVDEYDEEDDVGDEDIEEPLSFYPNKRPENGEVVGNDGSHDRSSMS